MRRIDLRASEIRRQLRHAAELELSGESIQKLKWFLYAAEHDGNVSLTCRHFGISRSTYLRWAKRYDANDLRTLEEQSRSPHTVREPETDPRIIALITELRMQKPMLGKELIATILQQTHGLSVSSSTVGRVISRHGLFFADTASHRRKRMQFLETQKINTAHSTSTVLPDAEVAQASDDELPYLPSAGITS